MAERVPFAGWREAGVDPSKPNMARIYDYWLGGTSSLTLDRELAKRMETLDRYIPVSCRANRAFLGRAVRYAAGQGIRQFLDIGSGIPTAGNVHEIAQQAAPGARVVYADIDPVAVADSRNLLAGNDGATVIQADLRDPAQILGHPEVQRLIRLTEPVAVTLAAVLHFLTPADDPYGVVAHLRNVMPPGSLLVISHAATEGSPALAEAAQRIYSKRVADGQARSRAEILRFFGGWELAEPGLVWAPQWRPNSLGDVPPDPERFWVLAGVARERERACR